MSEINLENGYVKMMVWLIPVIFGAGGVYAHVSRASADASEVRRVVQEHKEGVGHPVTAVRLDRIETNQNQMLIEQKKNAANIAAICQATGANCR